jgi:hypothetical protein
MKMRSKEQIEVVYGVVGESLIFILRAEADRLAAIHHALNSSKTWGDFKAAVPPEVYEQVLELRNDDEDEDDEPFSERKTFSLEDIPAVFDGDFPA